MFNDRVLGEVNLVRATCFVTSSGIYLATWLCPPAPSREFPPIPLTRRVHGTQLEEGGPFGCPHALWLVQLSGFLKGIGGRPSQVWVVACRCLEVAPTVSSVTEYLLSSTS